MKKQENENKVEMEAEVKFDNVDIDPEEIHVLPKKEGMFKRVGRCIKNFRNNHPVASTIIEGVVVFTGGILTGFELSNYVERRIKATVPKPPINITPKTDEIELPDIEFPDAEIEIQEEVN